MLNARLLCVLDFLENSDFCVCCQVSLCCDVLCTIIIITVAILSCDITHPIIMTVLAGGDEDLEESPRKKSRPNRQKRPASYRYVQSLLY